MSKVCACCKIEKDNTEFSPRKKSSDGLYPWCKLCKNTKSRADYNRRKDAILLRMRINYQKNKEAKAHYAKANRERINKRRRERIQEHPEYYAEKNRMRERKLRQNPKYRARKNLSRRALLCMTGQSKSAHMLELLGCTLEFFHEYIQSQFKEGMSWENYGLHGWHYDHILPCASFDLEDPEQQKQCFHYTNYQPLWAVDNIKKADNIGPEWGND